MNFKSPARKAAGPLAGLACMALVGGLFQSAASAGARNTVWHQTWGAALHRPVAFTDATGPATFHTFTTRPE
ncbi:hypothetical protein [Spirillospora sp. NPDC029432]|uniref:hypothetical protein n=1 Tax=Spirillospora sp. NPDC029432 TaxID=3154599 RepID=UPI0034512FA3